MKIIGLTGGIGSGKSTVADLLRAWGATVVDTDAIAHELTTFQGKAMNGIQAAFGTSIIAADGGLDRAALRRLVFANATLRMKLEELLHPLIRDVALQQIAESIAAPYVVVVIPLLTESLIQSYRIFRVAVVDCEDETRIERVMRRSLLSREDVLAIMTAQPSRHERLSIADDVIHNDGDLSSLRAQVDALHRQYQQP